jgi:hypothetical protein
MNGKSRIELPSTYEAHLSALIMASATPADDVSVEAPKPLKNWGFGDPIHHAGWPKVADAVIEAYLSTTKFDGMWKQLVRFLEKVKGNGHVSGKQSCS